MKTEINFFQGGTLVLTLHSKGIPTVEELSVRTGFEEVTVDGVIDRAIELGLEHPDRFMGFEVIEGKIQQAPVVTTVTKEFRPWLDRILGDDMWDLVVKEMSSEDVQTLFMG